MFMENLGENQPTFDVPTFTIQVNQMYLGKHTIHFFLWLRLKFNAQPDPVPSQIQISHSWCCSGGWNSLSNQKNVEIQQAKCLFFEASVGGGVFSILGNPGNSYKGD